MTCFLVENWERLSCLNISLVLLDLKNTSARRRVDITCSAMGLMRKSRMPSLFPYHCSIKIAATRSATHKCFNKY